MLGTLIYLYCKGYRYLKMILYLICLAGSRTSAEFILIKSLVMRARLSGRGTYLIVLSYSPASEADYIIIFGLLLVYIFMEFNFQYVYRLGIIFYDEGT